MSRSTSVGSLFPRPLRRRIAWAALCLALLLAGPWFFPRQASPVIIPAALTGKSSGARVYFSPEGRLLATMHWRPTSDGLYTVLRLHDVLTGEQTAELHSGPGQLESLAFSPDGREVAALWHHRLIQSWDASTGRELGRWERKEWSDWWPHSQVVYSPKGRLWRYGPETSGRKLYDVATGTPAAELKGRRGDHFWATIGVPGFFVSGNDREVVAWSLATAKQTGVFRPGGEKSGVIAITPDGRVLAGRVRTPTGYFFKVWRADTGAEHTLPAGEDASDADLSPDGRAVAVAVPLRPSELRAALDRLGGPFASADGGSAEVTAVKVFDPASGRRLLTLPQCVSARFSPDGRLLAAVCQDGTVQLRRSPRPASGTSP
jgi:WD40 repeat protein